jgi:putative hydrolase of the HAD superfamily
MLGHPIELLPDARETVEDLAQEFKLVLITKGDLLDQERKLAQSGLGELFHGVEILSDKTPAAYQMIFSRHGNGPETAMMVGNSMRSDVLPALQAGSWGVFIPHDLTWPLEHAAAPMNSARFRKIPRLGALRTLIDAL